MPLTGLREDKLKLILFGGKGGVGKTTCASSTGFYLAEDFNTLLLSTDPAHSLSDSLEKKIGDEIKKVPLTPLLAGQALAFIPPWRGSPPGGEEKDKGPSPPMGEGKSKGPSPPEGEKKSPAPPSPLGGEGRVRGQLSALEINAEKALSRFKTEYEDEIKKILDTSTYLDKEDIDSVFALPIPGMDEVMGFKTIVDLIEEAKFDKYIVDTAPTGHALRLLTLPDLLDDWIKVMAKMRWKYRYMVETFGGEYKADESDDFLVEMKKTVKRIESLLRDGQKCEFIAVTIPEDMAILETERLVSNLNEYGIKVKQLVVNNVHPHTNWRESLGFNTNWCEGGDCKFCKQRRKGQEKYINQIRRMFGDLKVTLVPLQAQEVKGIEALENFAKWLFE